MQEIKRKSNTQGLAQGGEPSQSQQLSTIANKRGLASNVTVPAISAMVPASNMQVAG